MLTACLSNPTLTTAQTDKAVCGAFRTISFDSEKDTDMTIDEIRGHNAAYRSVCKISLAK